MGPTSPGGSSVNHLATWTGDSQPALISPASYRDSWSTGVIDRTPARENEAASDGSVHLADNVAAQENRVPVEV